MTVRRMVLAAMVVLAPGSLAARAAQAGDSFDAGGVRIHYLDEGGGEPVVLLHGFALDHTRWRSAGIMDALVAEGYRVLAVDSRGHGASDKPHHPDAYGAELARDVVRLLDHLGVERAHVVGYSMGALIANKVREIAPERLSSVILGGAGWMKKGDPALADWTGPRIADSLERTGDFKGMLRAFTRNRVPPATDEEIAERNARMLEGNDLEALEAVLRSWDGLAVSEESLRDNQIPALALIGENDPLKVQVDAMAEVMANLDVVVIEDATHGALTDPAFRSHLLEFLEGRTSS